MVFIALSRAITDLLRPRIFGLVLTGIALTIGLFIALQAAVFFLIRNFVPGGFSLPFWGPIDFGTVLSWASLALFPLIGFFLMAPVAAAFSGLFAEKVADAVEDTHYPTARGQSLDFMDGLLESLAVMGAVIGVALLSLITMPILGPFSPVLFYGANGWLLGREFFQMAARRHLHEPQATALRQVNNARITWAGVLIAFLLTVPVLNIVVPVLAAAAFTHLFHLIRATTPQTR
ncbi:MAG: EI24 domain-containing protein [Paracoccus sp. (in: a-proteobacteria)]|uniref:EI24 domain-containing protein n=1 Tax=Paracoccus sp. TaxID=267 RepID=UPI0026DF9052|nr:EI24 domain-containing protein [Paracoccus sp. (in: a-proteobacteria)]MDO5632700.1 EI24 domain-containing protein [Paracoccus sp. (in: a-proteobacteria)]